MEIILKETIPSLGSAGDIVTVADGYARNYLLPQNKAILSSKKNKIALERQRAAILAKAAKQKEEHEALAAQLASMDLTIPVRVGEEDKLYGSVTSMDIAKVIEEKGYTVDKRKIQLEEPIKTLGDFEVEIKLSPEVATTVTVHVVAQEA